MEHLAPAYLSALAAQLGSLSAFLGGFAATFLATLLVTRQQTRLVTICIALAAVSSAAFIVAVVAATMLGFMLHPESARVLVAGATTMPRAAMTLGFAVGINALLGALACSGWTRSRTTGLITTGASVLGVVLIALLTVRIG